MTENTATTTAVESDPGPTKSLYVLSWVYWNGDEEGGGGFVWFPLDAALTDVHGCFLKECVGWDDGPARVRLSLMDVPTHLDGQALTDYLDGYAFDDVENGPALMECYIGFGAMPRPGRPNLP